MGEGGRARAVFVPVVRHTQVWLSANGTITSQAGGVRPPEQEQTEPGPRVSKSARAQGTAEGSWQGGSAGETEGRPRVCMWGQAGRWVGKGVNTRQLL